MKPTRVPILLLALVSVFLLPALAFAAGGGAVWVDGYPASPDTILVEAAQEVPGEALTASLGARGLAVQSFVTERGRRLAVPLAPDLDERISFATVSVPEGDSVEDAIAEAGSAPGVMSAWPNHLLHVSWAPNDPGYNQYQQNFRQIFVEEAWEFARGYGTVVAVVDTGYRLDTVEDAPTDLVAPYDVWGDDEDVQDFTGHGTHVANTIAQATNNEIGVAGIAYKARIMPVKIFPDEDGSATEDNLLAAVAYAVDNGAHVINMSLGGAGYNAIAERVFSDAFSAGVIPVCASGNDGEAEVDYPGAYEDCIAVGSVGLHEKGAAAMVSEFSNYGPRLDLVAPGEQIVQESWTEDHGAGLYMAWGTSNAAPHVAAVAAMMIGKAKTSDAEAIRRILFETAQDVGEPGWDERSGYGEVDAAAAVEAYAGTENDVPIAAFTADRRPGEPLRKIFLNPAGTVDPDGEIAVWAWELGDGRTSGEQAPEVWYADEGDYTISLTVTDEDGATATAAETIHIAGNADGYGQTLFPCGLPGRGGAALALVLLLLPLVVRALVFRRAR